MGGGDTQKGLSVKEKTHRDLLLFLFKSNYRKHKHMEKSSIINHPEITMFSIYLAGCPFNTQRARLEGTPIISQPDSTPSASSAALLG